MTHIIYTRYTAVYIWTFNLHTGLLQTDLARALSPCKIHTVYTSRTPQGGEPLCTQVLRSVGALRERLAAALPALGCVSRNLPSTPTFLSSTPTFLSSELTFLSSTPTFLSSKLTFLSSKLTFLSSKLTFLSSKLTFLSIAFLSGSPVYCGRFSERALRISNLAAPNEQYTRLSPGCIPCVCNGRCVSPPAGSSARQRWGAPRVCGRCCCGWQVNSEPAK
jgi:hypothetical protein